MEGIIMDRDQYLNEVYELVECEKRITNLENKIKNYIDTWVLEKEETEESKLLHVACMYNKLSILKEDKDKLFNKVSIGYKYIDKM
jgi:hypothetical protein